MNCYNFVCTSNNFFFQNVPIRNTMHFVNKYSIQPFGTPFSNMHNYE